MTRPYRPPKPISPRRRDAAARKLIIELGLDPYAGAKGLLLSVALIAVVAAVVFVLKAPTEPDTLAWGRVDGVGIVESEDGSSLVLQVETGGAHGSVHAPAWAVCRRGDRIALVRHRTRFAVHYEIAPPGCTRLH